MPNTVDITPSPRILRILGEIPFRPWQCLAEFIDNSVDAFSEAERAGITLTDKKITVSWSTESVASGARMIEVFDTGPGMTFAQLQNAVRAGYSSNDPIQNLGLFGMGFNIATARLGERTILMSATSESEEWTGIEIDFSSLIGGKNYNATVIHEPKRNPGEHGTKVAISRFKGDTYSQLRDQETSIRRQLENIYSTLLGEISVEIFVQGRKLSRRNCCVWSSTRYVSRENRNIPSVIQIDRDLGAALFDIERNAYLSRDEHGEIQRGFDVVGQYPPNIIERHKRLRGWVGIQRYADVNDFGIDFIRNGRKILISSKQFFSYENPLTGTTKLEYPVELGSTIGGRIIGEVHVDYLLPTYQKNDFDRTDPSWMETVEELRGVGPILPQERKAMGYSDANISPIGMLVNGYRRVDPGTKCLYVERNISKGYAERFRKGEPDFITDDKWWQAALEADRMNATRGASTAPDVDAGTAPSDNPDDYGHPSYVKPTLILPPTLPVPPLAPSAPTTSTLASLQKKAHEVVSWSGEYVYSTTPPLHVKVWELDQGVISKNSESVPCVFFQDGVDCDFVFNTRHPFLAQFPVEPRQLLALYLAEKFKVRDHQPDLGVVYAALVQLKLQDVRVDKAALQEKAASLFNRLREKFMDKLTGKMGLAIDCIHESAGEVEETIVALLSKGDILLKFQNKEEGCLDALHHVPARTLLRLVDRFTEDLFDGKVFKAPYVSLTLTDLQATARARTESKDRIMSFLKDALWILGQVGSHSGKDELARCAHSINFLSREIGD